MHVGTVCYKMRLVYLAAGNIIVSSDYIAHDLCRLQASQKPGRMFWLRDMVWLREKLGKSSG